MRLTRPTLGTSTIVQVRFSEVNISWGKLLKFESNLTEVKCCLQAGEREGDRGLLNVALNKDVNTAIKQPALLPGQLLVGNLHGKNIKMINWKFSRHSYYQVLPQSFGNIYLGETFSSYVCVHNDSTEVILWSNAFDDEAQSFSPGLWKCDSESGSSDCITANQLGARCQSWYQSSLKVSNSF